MGCPGRVAALSGCLPSQPCPWQEGNADSLSGPGRPSPPQDSEDETMLAAAHCAVAEHQDQHRQSITRDALRTRFGISDQAVSGLLRQVRVGERSYPPEATRAA
jgi:hypothetical protein